MPQVNKALWIDACFKLNADILKYSTTSGKSDPVDKKDKTTLATTTPLRQFVIPFTSPPDSNGNKNQSGNNTVLSDTGKIKSGVNINPSGFINANQNNTTITDTNGNYKNKTKPVINSTKGDTSKSIRNLNNRILTAKDTGFVKKDTVKVDLRALDSTARIEQFKYKRHDSPVINYRRIKIPSLYVRPSDNVRTRTVKIDSTGKFVEFREKYGGQETKIHLSMPIDQYIDLMIKERNKEDWEDAAYQYDLKDTKRGLQEFIKDFTDFEIPLPSVGVLTIFGEPKISLKIGGAVDIHGAWRNETTEGVTASNLGNTRNEPDFKQQVQINVNGTIGDKLNIAADWNTERTFEYENQLKIKYTGYEDEIIQSIEGGNVSLQTSPLVGGSEALFGVKAQFKLGPLNLTTLASQKKGEIKEVAVSGGSTSQTFQLKAYDFSKNHYFLDTIYADTSIGRNYFNNFYGHAISQIDRSVNIVQLEVWKSIQSTTGNRSNERIANAFINLPHLNKGGKYDETLRGDITAIPGSSEKGRFIKLTVNTDYTLHPETGFISFNTQINENDIIAVAYRYGAGSDNDLFYGEFIDPNASDSTKLILKLIKPANLQPSFTTAWKLMLKNIYPVGGRNVKQDGFEFQVKRQAEGQNDATDIGNVKLLTAFGLDIYDASGSNLAPDNIFDWRPGFTILPATGEIIFPVLQPFGRSLPASLASPDQLDQYRYNDIYDTSLTFARQNTEKDKWIMTGKYSGEVSSVYQLGFNIVENSVKVLLGGRQLTAGVDYVVDYNVGQLTIRNDAALVPGADLKISFEQNDLFQLASKTLLGLRGVFDFSKKTKLGFSILNLNQQTLSQKVRIGEEPLNNTIYGVDFTTGADLPFVTKALDKIMSTKEMSTFTVTGEYAYMKPDPNTIKSTIPSDQGKSIAYIDDFEAAKKLIPVGVSYTAWKDLSPPIKLPQFAGIPDYLYQDSLMSYKAKSYWYTITPSSTLVTDLWGTRKTVAKADQQVTVLDYVYQPNIPGTYAGFGTHVKPTDYSNPLNSWGGIMKPLSSTASNLIDENIQFIEFWANAKDCPAGSKIYIDLGRISEAVIPTNNSKLYSEDKYPFNDIIDQGEDNGLDGLTDAEERGVYGNDKSDPAGDDFSYTSGSPDYSNINGTEGNAVLTDIGRIPDTEDLNRNGNLDEVNSFFRYEIPLDTTSNNKFVQPGGIGTGWFLYRIPLKDFKENIGDASLTTVETIRMFVTGLNQNFHLRLAEFNLVGNQWQQVLPNDTTLILSVKSVEDNSDYHPPNGVSPEGDLTNPNEIVLRNEQSLNMIINDLPAGQKREIVKFIPGVKPLDVFDIPKLNYSFMGM